MHNTKIPGLNDHTWYYNSGLIQIPLLVALAVQIRMTDYYYFHVIIISAKTFFQLLIS